MEVIIILLSASILIAAGFLTAFIWSVKNGQYDDDYSPSVRILFDNKTKNDSQTQITSKTKKQ
jgi:cbb3-type cytochrome oxidase maturation protein